MGSKLLDVIYECPHIGTTLAQRNWFVLEPFARLFQTHTHMHFSTFLFMKTTKTSKMMKTTKIDRKSETIQSWKRSKVVNDQTEFDQMSKD